MHAKNLVLQSGAFAEHTIDSVAIDGERTEVGDSAMHVRLEPGAGARLLLRVQRFVNQPTVAFPWPTVTRPTEP